MASEESPQRRVFISYSWSSDEHVGWVCALGERLLADGVDVVLDQWSLKDGHDLNSFMERMVTDQSIHRVVIVSDERYASKADGREGGVGTEGQIISKEVYEQVDQEKFIPLLIERVDGEPCLPVFLRGRKYIDFSSDENFAYDALLRNIYERPARAKPALGTAPGYLFTDDSVSVPAAQKAARFKEVVSSGRGNAAAVFDDFADEFLGGLESLRLTYSRDQVDEWCTILEENIEQSRFHRDVFVLAVSCGARYVRDEWFIDSVTQLLERLLAYQNRPQQVGAFLECSEDNFKFLSYELFLYTVAILAKSGRHRDVRRLIDYRYLVADSMDSDVRRPRSFTRFDTRPSSLEDTCAVRGNSRRYSVMADLLHNRADTGKVRFSDLVQADVICCLASCASGGCIGWYPKSLIYAHNVGPIEVFARASTVESFAPIATMTGLENYEQLSEAIGTESFQRMMQHEAFWRSGFDLKEILNLGEIKQAFAANPDSPVVRPRAAR